MRPGVTIATCRRSASTDASSSIAPAPTTMSYAAVAEVDARPARSCSSASRGERCEHRVGDRVRIAAVGVDRRVGRGFVRRLRASRRAGASAPAGSPASNGRLAPVPTRCASTVDRRLQPHDDAASRATGSGSRRRAPCRRRTRSRAVPATRSRRRPPVVSSARNAGLAVAAKNSVNGMPVSVVDDVVGVDERTVEPLRARGGRRSSCRRPSDPTRTRWRACVTVTRATRGRRRGCARTRRASRRRTCAAPRTRARAPPSSPRRHRPPAPR